MALVLIGFALIIWLEVPSMVSQQQKRELRTFWVLLAIAFAISISLVRGWPIPNPTDYLRAFFGPIADWLGIK